MSMRATLALLFLGLILFVGAALQTPLMRYARAYAWDRVVGLTALVGGLRLHEADQPRLEQLLAENVRLRAEQTDYARLRQQLGAPAFVNFRAIPASVVGRPIDTFRSQLLLSRGTRQGVTVGAPVVVHGSQVVGFVSEVHAESAICQLLLHPATALTAEVLSSDKDVPPLQGLVQGKQYTSLLLTTVPRDKTLNIGQQIVTTAKPGLVPYGLAIATIKDVLNPPNEAFQSAVLSLPFDPDELRAVNVLVSSSS